MSPRVLALAAPLLLAAAPAFAQDADYGGDYYAGPSATAPITPYAQPPVAPPPPTFHARWSVALGVGTMSVTPDNDAGSKTDFNIGALAIRYRAWQHLELELAFSGGNQQLSDDAGGGEGDLRLSSVTLGARYRFNIQDHWNWWILAGLGSTTISPKDAPSDQMKADERPHALLGLGLEYRWDKFALQAEGKALAIGPTDEEQKTADANGTDAPSASGAQFTVGGAFYF